MEQTKQSQRGALEAAHRPAGPICTLQTASWLAGLFVDAWKNFKGSLPAAFL